MPVANGSREPSAPTRYTETADSWPREPLHVRYNRPAASNTGLSTWCTPVASTRPMSTNSVAPAAQRSLTAVRPPGRSSGTMAAIRDGAANDTRAGTPPITTSPDDASGRGKPSPRIQIRPPGTARRGSRPVTTGSGAADMRPNPSSPPALPCTRARADIPHESPAMTCPACGSPMTELALDGHYGATVRVDACAACAGLWFDGLELLQLTAGATLALFRHVGAWAPGARRPLAVVKPCPRCRV